MPGSSIAEDDRRGLVAAYQACGVSLGEVWLDYFNLGGVVHQHELRAYLEETATLPADQHNILAHAINERIADLPPQPRAPYRMSTAERGQVRPTAPPRSPAADSLPVTFGIEEEYLLLSRTTGTPVSAAPRVLAEAGRTGVGPSLDLQPELVRCQVEVATPASVERQELGEHLRRSRRHLAEVAGRQGLVLAAVGAAPLWAPDATVTDDTRYRDIHDRAPALVEAQMISGMHVHVAVPDPELGVTVMNRLRPWLHVLLALSANSPYWRGVDSGFASWRSVQAQRWPVEGPPPHWRGHTDYADTIEALLATGSVLDRGQLYWQMRLSDSYPTVELRVCDVSLEVDTATSLAAVIRALVVTALSEAADGIAEPRLSDPVVRAASWQAARFGLESEVVDLTRAIPQLRPAAQVVDRLVTRIEPALRASGDVDAVQTALSRLLDHGSGAVRQRQAYATGGAEGLLQLLSTTATS